MKLRTSLVAAATAVSMITTGISTPAFAEETGATDEVTTNNPDNDLEGDEKGTTPAEEETSGSSEKWDAMDSDKKAETIENWLGVANAVIGVLSAVFAFAAKYLPLPTAK